MTDEAVLARKLTSLLEHVGRMKRRRPLDVESFRRDVDLQDALSMSLLVAVQDAIDIALHFAADAGWGIPGSYGESFDLLASHGVIEAELAARLIGLASLRNRVAHGYASVDMARIHAEVPSGIEALEKFASRVAAKG